VRLFFVFLTRRKVMDDAKSSVMLMCGAEQVDREALEALPVPVGTETYFPIPHAELLTNLETAIADSRMEIVSESHGLTKGGDRYFGILQVRQPGAVVGGDGASLDDAFSYLLGVRNSHDKCFPASLVMGANVLVCDNLSFSGEVELRRKHTRHIMRDLPGLVNQATARLIESRDDVLNRFERYRDTEVSRVEAHHLIVTAAKHKALPKSRIMDVVDQWEKPNYADFEDRNAWSLYNAFTEIYKRQGLHTTVNRSQRLNGLFDQHCGLV